MTREEAKRRMEICRDFLANNYSDMGEPNFTAFNMAIKALSQEPTKEEQALLRKWRDNRGISIEEFEDAMNALQEPCDAISREDAINALANVPCYSGSIKSRMVGAIKGLPSVTQKSGKCKECKYFEYDSVAKVDGVPLIVAHEICNKWGDGCKTKEDGYCYLFEPQESEEI